MSHHLNDHLSQHRRRQKARGKWTSNAAHPYNNNERKRQSILNRNNTQHHQEHTTIRPRHAQPETPRSSPACDEEKEIDRRKPSPPLNPSTESNYSQLLPKNSTHKENPSSTTNNSHSPPRLRLAPTHRRLIPHSLRRHTIHDQILAPMQPLIRLIRIIILPRVSQSATPQPHTRPPTSHHDKHAVNHYIPSANRPRETRAP